MTVTLAFAVPPGPVQDKVNVEVTEIGSVNLLPEVAPWLNQFELDVQLVAFVELQVRVERLPELREVGEAVMVAVGAG